jgi:hypothetical protein
MPPLLPALLLLLLLQGTSSDRPPLARGGPASKSRTCAPTKQSGETDEYEPLLLVQSAPTLPWTSFSSSGAWACGCSWHLFAGVAILLLPKKKGSLRAPKIEYKYYDPSGCAADAHDAAGSDSDSDRPPPVPVPAASSLSSRFAHAAGCDGAEEAAPSRRKTMQAAAAAKMAARMVAATTPWAGRVQETEEEDGMSVRCDAMR